MTKEEKEINVIDFGAITVKVFHYMSHVIKDKKLEKKAWYRFLRVAHIILMVLMTVLCIGIFFEFVKNTKIGMLSFIFRLILFYYVGLTIIKTLIFGILYIIIGDRARKSL